MNLRKLLYSIPVAAFCGGYACTADAVLSQDIPESESSSAVSSYDQPQDSFNTPEEPVRPSAPAFSTVHSLAAPVPQPLAQVPATTYPAMPVPGSPLPPAPSPATTAIPYKSPTSPLPYFTPGLVPVENPAMPVAAAGWTPLPTPTLPTPGAPKHKSIVEWSGMSAPEPGSLTAAFLNGTPWIDIRYRYEDVSQDGIHRHAIASTLRSRLGYESGLYDDFKVGFEVQNLRDIGAEHFNNGINGHTLYPGVTDPENTDLRQGYIAYDGIPSTEIKAGRQLINLDNVRFIGSPDWRQLSQDYDAVTAYSTYFNRTTLFYGYVRQVNRNAGDDSPVGTYIGNTQLFNASYEFMPEFKVTGYSYLIDFESSNPAINSGSTASNGIRFTGTHKATDDLTLSYALEGAHQNSYGDNPAGVSQNYYLIEPAANAYNVTAKVGYEMLEGNGREAFQTPLATNHSFDGWADKFSVTPNNGLLDKYVSVAYKVPFGGEWIKDTTITGWYRNFRSDAGNVSDGQEWDGLIEHTFFGHYTTSLEVADYRAADLFTDTFKLMAFLTVKY